ncbi:MAG: DHHA1 domain-containing protein [Phycisphaerae bacterium]
MLTTPDDEKWMEYSVEYCGGTHVQTTSEIEHFVLIGEEGVAKGIRRVVGVTGARALESQQLGQKLQKEVNDLASCVENGKSASTGPLQQVLADAILPIVVRRRLSAQLAEIQKQIKKSEKEFNSEFAEASIDQLDDMIRTAPTIAGITIVVGRFPDLDQASLRTGIDRVRQKTEGSAVLLVTHGSGKVTLMAGMSKSAIAAGLKAGDLIREIAPHVGGKGGGRPDMAQGGGGNPDGIPEAINAATDWLRGKLGA